MIISFIFCLHSDPKNMCGDFRFQHKNKTKKFTSLLTGNNIRSNICVKFGDIQKSALLNVLVEVKKRSDNLFIFKISRNAERTMKQNMISPLLSYFSDRSENNNKSDNIWLKQ